MILSTRLLVTQSGADTRTALPFVMPSLDSKTALQILGFKAIWWDCSAVVAADYTCRALISTEDAALVPTNDEWVASVLWNCQNTAGVAVAFPVESVKSETLLIPRLTVQPYIYAQVDSASTGQANDIYFELFYSLEKLSELEYLRLLAGGA